jgi:hypothetical protein
MLYQEKSGNPDYIAKGHLHTAKNVAIVFNSFLKWVLTRSQMWLYFRYSV